MTTPSSCGRCHTCGGPILLILEINEWCPRDGQYQRPMSHGWTNPAPTAAEARPCSALSSPDEGAPPSAPGSDSCLFDGAVLIHRYSRQEAIEDGTLVDIPFAIREEFGIRFSLALTRAVWQEYVEVPDDLIGCQDRSGRLADVLTMFHHAARRCADNLLTFTVFVNNRADDQPASPGLLKAVVDAGDDGQGAITIMLPSES